MIREHTHNTPVQRRRLSIQGKVQGVGFRPFVYRLAKSLQVAGFVRNTGQGVTIEVEGNATRLAEFEARLQTDKPALSQIFSCSAQKLSATGASAFEIRMSGSTGMQNAMILPDIATCDDCLQDILTPGNRRYRYPFTNCTNCGPRYSIIESLPYDRPNTSMKRFTMCESCQSEYDDPSNRRFHAQPIACPDCGPQLALWDENGKSLCSRENALKRAMDMIRAGGILAVKGIGGFQLMVDARSADAVNALRQRKHREAKPFAIMVPSLDVATTLCEISPEERRTLCHDASPIVLLCRSEQHRYMLADQVAPGSPVLGVMLPYSPLHHLLLLGLGIPVVATSGNRTDEPICIDEEEVVRRLQGIADAFLVHDRPIVRQVDDSVVTHFGSHATILRRARGYAPDWVECPDTNKTILALGAHQKNSIAVAASGFIVPSQHIGDLATEQAQRVFERTSTDLCRLLDCSPNFVACDLHPDYLSSRHAKFLAAEDKPAIEVQHHHAHVVSCMVDNGITGTVFGVAWDGTGYGTDGTIWGGEFLRCDNRSFERFAHLRTFSLPGGDRAAREPRRSALGVLHAMFGDSIFADTHIPTHRSLKTEELSVLRIMLGKGLNAPITSSAGRLFDAVSSLLNVRHVSHFEGQAAMELENLAWKHQTTDAYPFCLQSRPLPGHAVQIDWRPMIEDILDDLSRGVSQERMARTFHNTLAEIIVATAVLAGDERVVLSGGCFQNRLLTQSAERRLVEEGFQVYRHRNVPPNDGGIAIGQAAIASRLAKEETSCV